MTHSSGYGMYLTRRHWLRCGLAGGLSMSGWLPELAAQAANHPARRRACILLWMAGGPTQTDTFDPKPGHANGGPFTTLATQTPGIRIAQHLPGVARHMNDLAIVRSMRTREGDHGRATYHLRTGYTSQPPIQFPALGSLVAKEREQPTADLPSYVSIGSQFANAAGFLGPRYAPLIVGQDGEYGFADGEGSTRVQNVAIPASVGRARFDQRQALARELESEFVQGRPGIATASHRHAYDRAERLMSPAATQAFDISREPANVRDSYGRTRFGQSCMLARRLVERGVPFVEVTLGGWDTHANNFNTVRNLCNTLDPAWSGLMNDLRNRGMLDSTLVVWMGEFGRTPIINPRNGRDHYPNAWSVVLGGGGIRGGQVVGRTSADGGTVEDRPVVVGDLQATICLALGLDPAKQNMSNVGRPIRLAEPTAQPLRGILGMKPFIAVLLCSTFTAAAWPQEALDLVMPDGKERLRIAITTQGETPTAKWHAFLDRWFDYFDANGDGMLQTQETTRLFPLPIPGNKVAPFDFAKADANSDAMVSRAELKAYYRQAGFTPLLTIAEPVSLKNLQIADALFRQLGPTADGRLTLDRFKRAPELLRKLDENENEVLSAAEVLSLGPDPMLQAPTRCAFAWSQTEQPVGDPSIRLRLADELIVSPVGTRLQPIASNTKNAAVRIRHPKALLAFSPSEVLPGKAVATSRQFVVAQFKSIVGKASAIEKRQVEDDASLQLLADLFAPADRDQDGKLTALELDRFLDLIAQGVNCAVLVTLTEHGRNLFLHLDSNADGRLDLGELNGAARQVLALGGEKGWTWSEVPHCVHVQVQQGYAGAAFGPLPLAVTASAPKTTAARRSTTGPAWFQAMDKNGDGLVSPREFLGPIELFRRMDRDGDGLISAEEAKAAGNGAGKQ